MKTGRFLLIAVLASILASVGVNGGDGSGQNWPGFGWSLAPSTPPAVKFRKEGLCSVPILSRTIAFKGGTTTGEEVTVRLDTARHTYEIRIDASKTPGRQGMRRQGKLLLDQRDCSYQLSGEAATRLAVNKDGVLFGGLDTEAADMADAESPALIVAFKNTSTDIVDLSGSWWVFESRSRGARHAGAAYETRILPDGQFSQCELNDGASRRCSSRIGRIHYNGKVFISREENGNIETLVVGRVAGKLVPIQLQQNSSGSSMRIFAARQPSALAPETPLGSP